MHTIPLKKFGDKRELDGYIYYGRRHDNPDKGKFCSPEYFEKYKKRIKVRARIKYDYIAKSVNDYKIKKGCAHCGYNKEAIALDFHHLDRKDKTNNVSRHWKSSWVQFEKMKKEIEKCIVLCANCHRVEEQKIRLEMKTKEMNGKD